MNMLKRFAVLFAVLLSFVAHAALTWETGSYNADSWTPSSDNILAGKTATFSGTKYTAESCNNTEPILTDGSIGAGAAWLGVTFGIKSSGSTLAWTWEAAKDIANVQIFTYWGDGGRDGIAVSKVEAMIGGAWTDIGAPVVSFGVGNNGSTAGRAKAILSNGGGAIAAGATGLRLTFGTQDNDGTGYCEIEAQELLADDFIHVVSSSENIGTPEPAYGMKLDVASGNNYTFTMTTPKIVDELNALRYTCTGWTYIDKDGKETSGTELEKTIAYEGGRCSFTWNWTAVPTGKKPGLYQKVYSGAFVITGDPAAEGDHAVVPGAMFACLPAANPTLTYTHKGVKYTLTTSQTAAYAGYMYMVGGVKYTFVKNFDDGGFVKVNGNTLINNNNWSDVVYGSFTPPETGYYPVDFRVGQGSSGIGPTATPFTTVNAGLLWSTNETTVVNIDNWHKLVNTEDDVYLYCEIPLDITIQSSPANVGTVSPAYGGIEVAEEGAAYTFSVVEPEVRDEDAGLLYRCTGWTFVDGAGGETSGSEFSKTITYEGGACSFIWNWSSTPIVYDPADFAHWIDLTIGTVASTVTDFPVPVKISKALYPKMDWKSFAANRDTLVFLAPDGKRLPAEIDEWPATDDGEALIWVKVPEVKTGTTFSLVWGASEAIGPMSPSLVWSDYVGVWHMNGYTQEGDTFVVADSSLTPSQKGEPMDATTADEPSIVDGVMGKAFYGAAGSSLMAPDWNNACDPNVAVSFWFKQPNQKYTALNQETTLFHRKVGQSWNYGSGWYFSTKAQNGVKDWNKSIIMVYNGGNTASFDTPELRSEWCHVQVFISGGNTAKVYMNGNLVNTKAGLGSLSSDTLTQLCAGAAMRDEMRVRGNPGDNWAAVEYASMTDPNFVTGEYVRQGGFFAETAAVAYDPATGFSVVGTLAGPGGKLYSVVTDVDGVAVTNLADDAAVAGEYAIPLTLADGDCYRVAALTDSAGELILTEADGWIYNGDVSVEKGDDCDFGNGRSGTFTVSRSSDASACAIDLVVRYTLGGTAEEGVDYKPLSGMVIIPAGERSATITVEPYYHSGLEADLSIALSLEAGFYKVNGEAGLAEIAYVHPSDAWELAGDNKTMTDASGWVLNCSVNNGEVTITSVKTVSDRSTLLDLTKKFTVPDFAVVAIGDSAFKDKTTITELYLPNTLQTIGKSAFSGCSGITSVTPFLPDSVNFIGQQAFYNCSKIETPLFIGMNGACTLQALSNKDYDNTFGGCSKLPEATVGPGVTEIAGKCFYNCTSLTNVTLSTGLLRLCTDAFAGCTNLETIDPFFPETLTYTGFCRTFQGDGKLKSDMHIPAGVTYLGANNFNGCKAITNVVVDCPSPISGACTWDGNAFAGWNNYQARFYVVNNVDWLTYANDTTKVTPWASLDAATQKKYTDMFGTDELPIGATTGFNKQFLVVRPLEGDAKSLVVTGDIGEFGTVTPAYGNYDVTGPMAISADEYVFDGDNRYRVLGYTLQKSVNGAYEEGEFVASRSFTYDPTEAGVVRLVWKFEFAGCRVSLWNYPAECGTVSVTGANPDGFFYGDNTVATLTATANDGEEFLGWGGDVPEADCYKTTITLDLTEPKNVIPVFKRGWTYASNQITDGYWTLNVSGSSGLSVNSVAVNPGIWLLDLAKPVDGGKTITSIGNGFIRNTSTPALREVRFPETLTSIGDYAFYGHKEVAKFEPLLPASVTSVGGEGMSYWSSDGHMAEGQTLTIGMEKQCSLGNQAFSDLQAIAIVIGPKQTSINSGNNAFRRMNKCKTVTYMCGKITHNSSTFANWGAYQARIYIPKDEYLDRAQTVVNNWLTDYLNDTTQVTPWKDLDEATKKKYTDAYPGEKKPFGLSVNNKGIYCGQQWIMTYNLRNSGTIIILR